MKKRSIFRRILAINVVSMLICSVILGTTQTFMLTRYIAKYNENNLIKNAEEIVKGIERAETQDNISRFINGVSRAAGAYIFVIDAGNNVLLQCDREDLIKKQPKYINPSYTKTVLSGEVYSSIGNLGGVYNMTMYNLQIPIKNNNGDIIGAVCLSRPIPEHQKMQHDLIKILCISMLVIFAFSIILSYIFAKSISVPIKKITESTVEFAKGKYSVRADAAVANSNVSEISELATSFNKMAEEIEKSEDVKNAFISDVSHELRTPMTTINGFVEGILDDTIPKEKHNDYLKIVHSEITRLSRLVNTFLDITRLSSDKLVLNMVDFDICEVIRIAVIGHEPIIKEKNINVELNLDSEKCFVNADQDSITRVITNLIDNAVKFTDENKDIIIYVREVSREFEISVKNYGCGLSEEQKTMIFKRFYKVDKSRSVNKEGTGIGLYLVKNILSAHNKKINVNSVEGEFAEFTFRLNKSKQNKIKNYKN